MDAELLELQDEPTARAMLAARWTASADAVLAFAGALLVSGQVDSVAAAVDLATETRARLLRDEVFFRSAVSSPDGSAVSALHRQLLGDRLE